MDSMIDNSFDLPVRAGGNDPQASNSGTIREGLPTPASLAEVLLSTRQMLVNQAGERIQQLARQLEDQANVTDASERTNVQSNAWRTGILLQSIGSLLLELGRTTTTLRLGQTPSEAVVNAGPAVFITPTGPIPCMVQALSFQPGTSLGTIPMGTAQPGSGVINGHGTRFLPRRIDIEIRRGSTTSTPDIVQQEHHDTSQQSGQRIPSMGSGSENHSTQTTASVSDAPSLGRIPSDSSGSLPNADSRQQDRSNTHSANRTQNNQESERQIPSSILQFLREFFPGGEIQVEETTLQGTETETVPEHAGTSGGNAAPEPSITDEGVFLSNLLHQIMPCISQHVGSQQSTVSTEEANTSNQAESSRTGNSRRPSDSEPNPPNSKRQKTE